MSDLMSDERLAELVAEEYHFSNLFERDAEVARRLAHDHIEMRTALQAERAHVATLRLAHERDAAVIAAADELAIACSRIPEGLRLGGAIPGALDAYLAARKEAAHADDAR